MEIGLRKTREPKTGSLLAIGQRPVFPVAVLRFEKIRKGSTEPTFLRFKVGQELYDYVTKVFGTDELVLYLDPENAKIELWTPGMHMTFEAMEEVGLMGSKAKWVENARSFLKKTLSEALRKMR